jgi:hypothetical protein
MHDPLQESLSLSLPDADITYFPNFLPQPEAEVYLDVLKKNVPWQQDRISIFGKTHPQPRLTALYGNNGRPYTYFNIKMRPHNFTKELLEPKEKIGGRDKNRFYHLPS